jgi:hypothetical protein
MIKNNPEFNKICHLFRDDIQELILGHDPTPAFLTWLYDYYTGNGEMPYGVAKARDGDPYEWCIEQFRKDADLN